LLGTTAVLPRGNMVPTANKFYAVGSHACIYLPRTGISAPRHG
jgi:hypothetical protein